MLRTSAGTTRSLIVPTGVGEREMADASVVFKKFAQELASDFCSWARRRDES